MDAFRKVFPGEYYKKFLAQNVRPDDRSLLSVRKTTISLGTTPLYRFQVAIYVSNTACALILDLLLPFAIIGRELLSSSKSSKTNLFLCIMFACALNCMDTRRNYICIWLIVRQDWKYDHFMWN